jgi:hypothetical protein
MWTVDCMKGYKELGGERDEANFRNEGSKVNVGEEVVENYLWEELPAVNESS